MDILNKELMSGYAESALSRRNTRNCPNCKEGFLKKRPINVLYIFKFDGIKLLERTNKKLISDNWARVCTKCSYGEKCEPANYSEIEF